MIEKIKSILLTFLVLSSLFLTYQLWYGQKPAELVAEDVYERIVMEKPRSLVQAITPAQISLAAGDGYYYLLRFGEPAFQFSWSMLSLLLADIEEDIFFEQSAPPEEALNCLTYYFQPVLPVGDDLPWLSGMPYLEVSAIEVFCLEDQVWFVFIAKEGVVARSLQLPARIAKSVSAMILNIDVQNKILYSKETEDTLSAFLGRDLMIEKPLYLPVESIPLQQIALSTEPIDHELLLKTFFVDYNLTRVIEERDGSLIYTDGERGLRVTESGTDYSYPRLEEGQATAAYPEAIINSSTLIGYHGGWPANLRLEELFLTGRAESSHYTSVWIAYHQGKPIHTKRPTRILFNDLGLFDYKRSVFFTSEAQPEEEGLDFEDANNVAEAIDIEEILENGEELTSEEDRFQNAEWANALSKAVAEFDASLPEIRIKLRLEAVKLGYAVTGTPGFPFGEPVWFIQINGERYFVKVSDFTLLEEEEML